MHLGHILRALMTKKKKKGEIVYIGSYFIAQNIMNSVAHTVLLRCVNTCQAYSLHGENSYCMQDFDGAAIWKTEKDTVN